MPTLADSLDDLFLPLCCGCWIIPLVALLTINSVVVGLVTAWQTRGIGNDGLYCARCKFDVRGATNWQCSECGSELRRWFGPGSPRGGIIIKGLNPPMSPATTILFYLIACFAPAVVFMSFVGMVLPINTRYSLDATLSIPASNWQPGIFAPEVSFYGIAEPGWLGPGRLEMLRSNNLDWSELPLVYADGKLTRASAERVWAQVIEAEPWLDASPNREALREEFIDLLGAIARFDQADARARAKLFKLRWHTETATDYHPAYFFIAGTVVFGVLLFAAYRAVRDAEWRQQNYYTRVKAVQERFAFIVEQNIARMNKRDPHA